ncbi:hypothetical protein JCGZ_02511 [Jatropha curcas]|uniref:Uncharacterized protein n=1 Tax=Jatropha curcas TaxID=180498 RepID=A0A067JT19_JATCU|nr:uncharacterized protein LOC119371255 [Jatropha curcas]KDP22669.1 hypothetical protein JCGZ_02511 [Jatropha curcas]
MEAIQLFSSSSTPFRQQRLPFRRKTNLGPVIVKARGEANYGRDYWDMSVDENMITLRKRIKEINMLEKNDEPDWMEWEKEYFIHYNNDVCEAMGLLQNYLMSVRPSLGIGTMIFVTFCILFFAGTVSFHALEIARGIVSQFHSI